MNIKSSGIKRAFKTLYLMDYTEETISYILNILEDEYKILEDELKIILDKEDSLCYN